MAEASSVPQKVTPEEAHQPRSSLRGLLRSTEIDMRLLGMIGLLGLIWIGFNVMSGGLFLTPRNLFNLSVQSASTAIMATGMVLIIVSRNIDLSVGSMLGFIGYTMAMVQVEWIPKALGLGLDQPYTWLVALVIGIALGALIGGIQGVIVAYGRVPAFIVTLGGLLVWRALIFRYAQGQTLAPMDKNYQMLGGAPATGSMGDIASWILGAIVCVGIVYTIISGRRRRLKYGFQPRPQWAELVIAAFGCGAVIIGIYVMNNYAWPEALAHQYAIDHNVTEPPGGLIIPVGIAYPVLIALGVMLLMTYLATRRRFGRYVFSIGGNPEAAELGGINVRRTLTLTFVLMGMLTAVSAAVQTARLNSAVTNLGTQAELDVISAAVIGGTSFSGGIGTIPGAVLGAVVMQSLRSGMLLLRADSPTQDIVVGLVLVAAVGVDTYFRNRGSR